jgi:hypothetical protein
MDGITSIGTYDLEHGSKPKGCVDGNSLIIEAQVMFIRKIPAEIPSQTQTTGLLTKTDDTNWNLRKFKYLVKEMSFAKCCFCCFPSPKTTRHRPTRPAESPPGVTDFRKK